MSEEEKILKFLGLAARAGKADSGGDAVEAALRKGKAELLLIAEDISRNSLDSILSAAKVYESKRGVPVACFSFSDKESLGKALGKADRSAVAVTDTGFAAKLEEMLEGYKEDV